MAEQVTHPIENLHIAVGYGKFKFTRGYDLLEMDVPKHCAYKSGGIKENLERNFQAELEAEVMGIVLTRQGPGWKLIESYPIITITPATKEEKLLVMLAAARKGKLFITKNPEQKDET